MYIHTYIQLTGRHSTMKTFFNNPTYGLDKQNLEYEVFCTNYHQIVKDKITGLTESLKW